MPLGDAANMMSERALDDQSNKSRAGMAFGANTTITGGMDMGAVVGGMEANGVSHTFPGYDDEMMRETAQFGPDTTDAHRQSHGDSRNATISVRMETASTEQTEPQAPAPAVQRGRTVIHKSNSKHDAFGSLGK